MNWWLDGDNDDDNAVRCDVCGVVGPGTGWGIMRPRYHGLAEGWTVHREGMTGARPRCPEHSSGKATCGPVNVDADGRDVA
jgi:hypothetical protein